MNGFDTSKMSYDVTGNLIDTSKPQVANTNYPVGNLADPGNISFDFGSKTVEDILAQRQVDWDHMESERKAVESAKISPISQSDSTNAAPVLVVDPTKSTSSTSVAIPVEEVADEKQPDLIPLEDVLEGDAYTDGQTYWNE